MNKLGILIDAAHCGDQTTLDIIEESELPIVISHAGARALWDTPATQAGPRAGGHGGQGRHTGNRSGSAHDSDRAASTPQYRVVHGKHFEYAVRLIGIEHVGFGPDTMFGDHVGLHRAYAAQLSVDKILGNKAFDPVEYVDGPGESCRLSQHRAVAGQTGAMRIQTLPRLSAGTCCAFSPRCGYAKGRFKH